jgi:hypothetical protein
MHELTAAECDADMRRPFVHGFEEDEVARPHLILINLLSYFILLARFAR